MFPYFGHLLVQIKRSYAFQKMVIESWLHFVQLQVNIILFRFMLWIVLSFSGQFYVKITKFVKKKGKNLLYFINCDEKPHNKLQFERNLWTSSHNFNLPFHKTTCLFLNYVSNSFTTFTYNCCNWRTETSASVVLLFIIPTFFVTIL